MIQIDKAKPKKKTNKKGSKISKVDISGPDTGSFLHVSGMQLDGSGDLKKVDNTDKLDPALRKFLAIAGLDEKNLSEEQKKQVQQFVEKENINDIYDKKKRITTPNRKPEPSPQVPVRNPERPPVPAFPPSRQHRRPGQVPPPPIGPPPTPEKHQVKPPPPTPEKHQVGPPPPPPPVPSPMPGPHPSPSNKPKKDDFRSQIINFKPENLNNVNPNEISKKETSKSDDHLAAIRKGIQLKSVNDRVIEQKKPLSPSGGGGLDDVLKQALEVFKNANELSDEENDDDDHSSGWSSEEEEN